MEKPAGVLCVPGKDGAANLAEAVCESFCCQMGRPDMMVVHRLGMDNLGLVVFVKTMEAVRGMNTVFRTRKIEQKYEALVCGQCREGQRNDQSPTYARLQIPTVHAYLNR